MTKTTVTVHPSDVRRWAKDLTIYIRVPRTLAWRVRLSRLLIRWLDALGAVEVWTAHEWAERMTFRDRVPWREMSHLVIDERFTPDESLAVVREWLVTNRTVEGDGLPPTRNAE